MALYSKFCVICTREFTCQRIGTAYCSKKCANRARSLPSKLLQRLVQRSAQFTMSNIVEVRTKRKEEVPGATEDNPLGEALPIIEAQAREMARERGVYNPGYNVKKAKIKTPDFEFSIIEDDKDQTVDNSGGFKGTDNTNSTNTNNTSPVPLKTGIRKIGGGKK